VSIGAAGDPEQRKQRKAQLRQRIAELPYLKHAGMTTFLDRQLRVLADKVLCCLQKSQDNTSLEYSYSNLSLYLRHPGGNILEYPLHLHVTAGDMRAAVNMNTAFATYHAGRGRVAARPPRGNWFQPLSAWKPPRNLGDFVPEQHPLPPRVPKQQHQMTPNSQMRPCRRQKQGMEESNNDTARNLADQMDHGV
jgi:hypothetical protein